MERLESRIDLLEQAITEATERVGELCTRNRLLKQQIARLQHQLADKSRQLAVLEQAEEKFVELQRQTARIKDERQKLKSGVEHLLRQVASLKAAVLDLD